MRKEGERPHSNGLLPSLHGLLSLLGLRRTTGACSLPLRCAMPTKYAHTNLIAKDWKRLSVFYQDVFDCTPVPPERDLGGEWLDRATGLVRAHIRGIHLRLPGYGAAGPTLEIFEYGSMPSRPEVKPNTPGFSHIAFAVDEIETTVEKILAHGGSALGVLTVRDYPGVGVLTFQYVTDPEGNMIEVQSWAKSGS